MIGPGQGQDELTRLLQSFVDLDALGLQVGWRDHRYDVEEDVGVLLE